MDEKLPKLATVATAVHWLRRRRVSAPRRGSHGRGAAARGALLAIAPAFALAASATATEGGSAGHSSASHQWVRPVGDDSPPLWGHAEGLSVGLAPLRGPRGLLRIYAPYVGQPAGRLINFIAVEPIPLGEAERGLSELEFSKLDQRPGKRFWSRNNLDDVSPQPPERPAAGWIDAVDGVECLRVLVLVERFDNGAHVYLRLTFRGDRPHEVGVATYAHADSRPLGNCIVTATMGNYARLRRLHLADRTVQAEELWPDYRGDGFTPHARFPFEALTRTDTGAAFVAATPSETDPASADYAAGTRGHWHYQGAAARQSWRCDAPRPGLEVLVNGRTTYWASQSPIPGGVAFENFEMAAPFRNGDEFWFGVEPLDIRAD